MSLRTGSSPRAFLVVVATALALAGCGGSEESPEQPRPLQRLVALGDSTAAGLGIPPSVGPASCGRSASAYPSKVATRWPTADLVDASCSGARIAHLTAPQELGEAPSQPPQLDALDTETQVVTLTIGGNDAGYLQLFGGSCLAAAEVEPGGAPCRDRAEAAGISPPAVAARIHDDLSAALTSISERAPEADVLVVGYGALAGDHGPCEQLPLTPRDHAFADRMMQVLNGALEQAADETGATYVDVHAAARAHDVCAPEPWANGVSTDGDGAVAHARSAFHVAAADLVDEALVDLGWQR